ncbi:YdgA family protein [Pseudomonas sp. QE6]|uniref:YdgA family protein n=1 Tax=Pseudomonas sp. QE6 TaxID=3242491 RepID=UPI00352911BF
MNKTTLAIAIPLAIVGVAVAGAWYTGSRVEQEITRGIEQANTLLKTDAPDLGMSVSLLGVERGLLSSSARYQVTIAGNEGEAPTTLVFTDRLEHGPFPASRLAAGKLAPVMAQSHFALEQNEFTAPLFAAAAGKAPISGELAIHYDQQQEGVFESAALQFAKDGESLRLSPAKVNFSVSGDKKDVRADGQLAEADLVFLDPQSGQPVQVQLRDLGIAGDKKENANGFALGPSSVSLKSLHVKAPGSPDVELRQAVGEEVLKQGEKGLDQTLSYRVGQLVVQGQEIGGLKLDTSLRNLDEGTLKSLKETYNQYGMSSVGETGELTPEQEEALKGQFLRLLDSSPKLALDELSLQTAHGVAKVSLAVDLRKPAKTAETPDEMARSVLASLRANLKVDKAVIGDVVSLQAALGGAEAGSVDPVALKQQTDAMTDLFSGMALQSEWAVLDGNSLSSSLAYADDKVKFNGKDMTTEEFVAFATGSVQGLGLGAGADDEAVEQAVE